MPGTVLGGKLAAESNKRKYGEDFYSRIGKIGGKKSCGGGFAYGDNGKKFGKIGGRLSKRSRVINEDSKLKSEEINELIPLAIRALGVLRLQGIIDIDKEQSAHVTLYEKAALNDWKFIFTDLSVGPSIQIAWKTVLSEELEKYRKMFYDDTVVKSIDDNNRYKAIRNLDKAFQVATNVSGKFKAK